MNGVPQVYPDGEVARVYPDGGERALGNQTGGVPEPDGQETAQESNAALDY